MTYPTPITITLIPETRTIGAIYADIDANLMFLSEDERARVYTTQHDPPIVCEVYLNDESKYTLIEDWLEEAIASALGEAYDDNHIKGNNIEHT